MEGKYFYFNIFSFVCVTCLAFYLMSLMFLIYGFTINLWLYCCIFALLPRSRLSFYGVFDGHGGKKASKYAADHLHKIIAQKFPKGNVVVTSSQLQIIVFNMNFWWVFFFGIIEVECLSTPRTNDVFYTFIPVRICCHPLHFWGLWNPLLCWTLALVVYNFYSMTMHAQLVLAMSVSCW